MPERDANGVPGSPYTDDELARLAAGQMPFADGWQVTAMGLAREVIGLRAQVAGHCERIAKQSELLSRRAEK
jgi:hypothetical protein